MANRQRAVKTRQLGNGRWKAIVRSVAALCALYVVFAASQAMAITIVLKTGGSTIRAILVRKYATGIVVDEVKADGSKQRRDIPLNAIELVLDPIDAERLATLDPAKPQSYRIYAEELAEKKADPDARAMAIRLYLIAANLDRESLGKSSLLGMTALARTSSEERRFRAMVYLLDAKHDRRMLETPMNTSAPSTEVTDDATKRVIQALRFLRRGRIKEARNLSRREGFKSVLANHSDLLTAADFDEATNPRCPQCEFGKETCPTCSGSGRIDGRACPSCYGRKTITCQRCSGNYKEPPLADDMLKKFIILELALLGESHLATAPTIEEAEATPWSKLIRDRETRPAPSLKLETLTEFDPRQNTYRDGKWQVAKE